MNKEYKPITNLWKDSEGYRYFGTLKLSSKIKYDGDDFIPLWEWINQLQQENKKQKEVIDKAINELFILKDMIYKPETREENFEIQRKISSLIKRLNGKEVSE